VSARLLDLIDGSPRDGQGAHIRDRPRLRVLPPDPAGAPVRLEAVSFAYPTRPGLALDGIDLRLDPGETLALVGPSGSGKSTVASLVLGLARPTHGRVIAEAVDLARGDLDAWRAQVAWVPQHPTLFRGTVASNIRLSDAAASDERVREAAEAVGAAAFIEELPGGYDTVIGDGGRPLSAGQAQRIALARAFLRQAPLLVLDEPTSHLDPASADRVRDTIRRRRVGRTMLVIAHRPDVVANADRVVRLAAGRIVEPAEPRVVGAAR
jgi:ABC-type multidrug transport system fused ATPase/permease subunit